MALASEDVQLLKSPAEQFCINPLFPYTNRYGNNITTPPETEILLSNVSVCAPLEVAELLKTAVQRFDVIDANAVIDPWNPVPEPIPPPLKVNVSWNM